MITSIHYILYINNKTKRREFNKIEIKKRFHSFHNQPWKIKRENIAIILK